MLDGLFEREDELARIDALLAAARAGKGGLLVITGPAGIGKTVLLTEARKRGRRAGIRVLAGRGGELERGFSFGVVRQLLEPLLSGASTVERGKLLAGPARQALIAMEDGLSPSPTAVRSDALFGVVHACTGWR